MIDRGDLRTEQGSAQGWGERLAMLGLLLLPILVLFKRVPAEIAVGVTVIAAVAVGVRRRDFSWLAQGWVYAAALLSLVLLLLSPFSLKPGYSALSAMLAFRWPVYAAALVWVFTRRPQWLERFEWAMVLTIAFIVADTVLQYFLRVDIFGHLPRSAIRLTGPFAHPLVGTFSDRVWFIGLSALWFLALARSVALGLLVLSISTAIGAVFLFLAGERAALLTFLLGTALVFLGVLIHYPAWRKRLVLTSLAMLILAVGFAVTQKTMIQRSVESTIHTIAHLDKSVYGLNFKAAFEEFEQHPWVGVGARQFKEYCDANLPGAVQRYHELLSWNQCALHPHNFYTGMLAEGGVFSFVVFVVMIFLLFKAVVGSASDSGRLMSAYFGSALLLTTFWPLQSSMEYFNGWTAAVIWTGVGWAIARARVPMAKSTG